MPSCMIFLQESSGVRKWNKRECQTDESTEQYSHYLKGISFKIELLQQRQIDVFCALTNFEFCEKISRYVQRGETTAIK